MDFQAQIVDGQPVDTCPICGEPIEAPCTVVSRAGDRCHAECWAEYCEELEIELDKEPNHVFVHDKPDEK